MDLLDVAILAWKADPEDSWCCGDLTNNMGQHCALGHLIDAGIDAGLVADLFRQKLGPFLSQINDGQSPDFAQDSPRKRTLAAAQKIRSME